MKTEEKLLAAILSGNAEVGAEAAAAFWQERYEEAAKNDWLVASQRLGPGKPWPEEYRHARRTLVIYPGCESLYSENFREICMSTNASDELPELEVLCQECEGDLQYNDNTCGPWEPCGSCGGTGCELTELGEKVLALMQRHFKRLLQDHLR